MSFFIPIHQKLFLKSWYILLFPGCMVYLDLWASSKILFLKFPFLGTQILFLWNLQIPSIPCSNSFILPFIPSALSSIAVA
ncbi:hypothetical protein HanIR_Chr11g0549461 [Helianthus annuus]|nr:hypothetical protein HanIR_Chr11g0549461 [Helianthus annuus]